MKFVKSIKIKVKFLILALVLTTSFFGHFSAVSFVYAWGASSGHDSDMDCLDDNPFTADNPDGSCDECGNGGWGGYSSSYCSPVYVNCASAPNICGWTNKGVQDVSCGGACTAVKPSDPTFIIGGLHKKVGDECSVIDSCGRNINGVITCSGVCTISSGVCDYKSRERTDNNNNNTNSPALDSSFFNQVSTVIISFVIPNWVKDIIAKVSNSGLFQQDKHYVAIKAFPNIVQKGDKTTLYVYLANLDYCIIEGDNGVRWGTFGMSKSKLDYLKSEGVNFDEEIDTELKSIGNIFYRESSPINTETIFTVKKCFTVDHNGNKKEYTPKEPNDIVKAKVKVVPEFIEK